ncbi:ABC-F family ATP-binding cassette domain-containing protein [Candidatus Liberibacter americanus]|nr:ABC-F family ATP-binding cassette domain-containing protein [Candidatus Liberibacter americanus]EMS35975.1 ABC transporter ATP-binding protein [Candidatus Liberibacter americanus PW_SP]
MNIPILRFDNINATIGGVDLLRDVCFSVKPKERLCLVGRNGSGKSTLLKIAAGLIEPQSGKVFISASAKLGYLEQEFNYPNSATICDYIESATKEEHNYSLTSFLKIFNLTGKEKISDLSVGQARCVALIRIFIMRPDVLILDEPTNHLDYITINWLEQELININSAIIFVSHDRRFLKILSTSTIWLDRGCVHLLDKGFSHFEDWRDGILEKEKLHYYHLKKKNETEEDWLRYGVTARRKRNVRRLKELQEIRTDLSEKKKSFHREIKAEIKSTKSSGKLVIDANQINKDYNGISIIKDFSLRIKYGERIGIVGPNGSGKTTLLKILTGKIQPESGSLIFGTNLKIAIIDQKREDLNINKTLASYLTGGAGDNLIVNGQSRHVMGYIKDFLFQSNQAHSLIKNLSGGERMRAILARVLSKPFNFLIMDEPTNDLDFETLYFLEEIISKFQGTILLVSHDRDFLDHSVTSIISLHSIKHPNGRWIKYAGGYSDMILQQKKNDCFLESREVNKNKDKISNSHQQKIRQKKINKLSYGQKLLLKSLPQKIQEIHAKIKENENKLCDQTLFIKDQNKFYRISDELGKLYQEVKEKEEEWLKLEISREEEINYSNTK